MIGIDQIEPPSTFLLPELPSNRAIVDIYNRSISQLREVNFFYAIAITIAKLTR